MFKKILVATDTSDYSKRALESAIDLAKEFGGQIELFHVIDYPAMYGGLSLSVDNYVLSEEKQVELSGHVMESTLKGVDTKGVVIERKSVMGNPAVEIVAESAKGFDLIVMGTSGHSPLGGAIIGSVTQKVVGKAACPVLAVK
jgi:nucleotide-binding universal stress UspA family protein